MKINSSKYLFESLKPSEPINEIRMFFCFVLTCLMAGSVHGQTDFFWSFQGLRQGAVNGPASNEYEVGDIGSIYLYYTTNGPANSDLTVGAFLDVAFSRPGVAEFVSAETFDFEYVFGFVECPRWNGVFTKCGSPFGASGNIGLVRPDLISEWGAFTVADLGIDAMFSRLETGFDVDADAFLFGRVDFVIVSDVRGSTELIVNVGDGKAVSEVDGPGNQEAFEVDVNFGEAAIHVNDSILLGDVNLDEEVDLLDVSPFVDLVMANKFQVEADVNQDGEVDLQDVSDFVDLVVGTPPPFNPPAVPSDNLLGDVNCDGFVNLLDITPLWEILNGDTSVCDVATADLNGDGEVNAIDLTLIDQVILDALHKSD